MAKQSERQQNTRTVPRSSLKSPDTKATKKPRRVTVRICEAVERVKGSGERNFTIFTHTKTTLFPQFSPRITLSAQEKYEAHEAVAGILATKAGSLASYLNTVKVLLEARGFKDALRLQMAIEPDALQVDTDLRLDVSTIFFVACNCTTTAEWRNIVVALLRALNPRGLVELPPAQLVSSSAHLVNLAENDIMRQLKSLEF